ncbi:DMT family transporter [Actinoplanes sp. GCM10030250]|uniref:DMT family transporter n=1 Tax=Actinoplanes sp. GCM10030250 TaxID=3273376 RepID=UPI0036146879
MGSLGWAVCLSLLSVGAYATAAVAQERLAEHDHRGLSRWAVALLLTGAGVVLHVLALNFGTVAVVQALGTLTLLVALPIEVIRYHTPISRTAWLHAGLTVGGLIVILSLSVESEDSAVLAESTVRTLAWVTAGVVVACSGAAWRAGPTARAMLLAGAAGTAHGIGSVMAKAVLASFTTGGAGAVSVTAAMLVVAFAVAGYLLGQLAYRGAGLAAPLATVSVTNPLVAAFAGVVLFDEGVRFGPVGLAAAGVAAVVMGWGVVGLARRTAGSGSRGESGGASPLERAEAE